MIKKVMRYAAFGLTGVVGLVVVFALISIGPVDRTPANELPSYQAMMDSLENLVISVDDSTGGFSVGYGKVSITPPRPVATAGYGKRKGKLYKTIHDSIFVRTMVIRNGLHKVAIVSADLLIMPPTVTRLLDEKLSGTGFTLDNTYLSATHTHNSIGHWGEGATRFIYGPYEDSVVHFIADGIVRSIIAAEADVTPAIIRSGAIPIPGAVENRLIDNGPEDPWLRVLEVQRADSTTAVLVSYAAHATCLASATLALSGDYPSEVIDKLESNGFDFAMFLAGAVGSHKVSTPTLDWECISWMAEQITDAFLSGRARLQVVRGDALVMKRVDLPLGDPQVKISRKWKLRSWLFRSAFGEYDAFLTVLRIGNVVMLGTPCDFSGELVRSLDSTAAGFQMQAVVTSFNGGYIGYVTPGKYFDIDHYETRLMNWYAPGTGEYIRKCLQKLIVAASDTR